MDEMVKQVAQRTGIPEDKARLAVQAVLDQLEKRLPGPIAAQVKAHLGGSAGAGAIGDVKKGLGGMLGS